MADSRNCNRHSSPSIKLRADDDARSETRSRMSSSSFKRSEKKLMELRKLQKTIMSKPIQQDYQRRKLCRHLVVAKLSHCISDKDTDVSTYALNLLCGTVPRLSNKIDELLLPMVPRVIPLLAHDSKHVRCQSLRFLRIYFKHCLDKTIFIELYVRQGFHNREKRTRRMCYNVVSVLFDVDDDDDESCVAFIAPQLAKQLEVEPEFMQNNVFNALSKIHRLVGEERFYSYLEVCSSKTISIYNVWLLSASKSEQNLNCDDLMSQYQETRQSLGLSKDYGILHPALLEDIKNTSGVERCSAISRLLFYMRKTNWEDVDLEPHLVDMLSLVNCFLADEQRTIQMEGLEIIRVLVDRVSIGLAPHLGQILKGLTKVLLSLNPHVKKRASMVLHKLKVNVHPMTVTLVMFSSVKKSRNIFLKEEVLYQLVATLSYFPYYDFDLPVLCQLVGQYLDEKVENVRRAAENCFMHMIKVMDDAPVEGLRGRAVFSLLNNGKMRTNIMEALDIRLPLGGLGQTNWSSTNTPSSGSEDRRFNFEDDELESTSQSEFDQHINAGHTNDVSSRSGRKAEVLKINGSARRTWTNTMENMNLPSVTVDNPVKSRDGCLKQKASSPFHLLPEESDMVLSQAHVRSNSSQGSYHHQMHIRKSWNLSPSTPNLNDTLQPHLRYTDTSDVSDLTLGSANALNKEYDKKMGVFTPEEEGYGICYPECEIVEVPMCPDEAGDREIVGRLENSLEHSVVCEAIRNLKSSKSHRASRQDNEQLDSQRFNFNIVQVTTGSTVELSEGDMPANLASNSADWVEALDDSVPEEIVPERRILSPVEEVEEQPSGRGSRSQFEGENNLAPETNDSDIEEDSLAAASPESSGNRSVMSECSIAVAEYGSPSVETDNESIPDASTKEADIDDCESNYINQEEIPECLPNAQICVNTEVKEPEQVPEERNCMDSSFGADRRVLLDAVFCAKPCISEEFEVNVLNDVKTFSQEPDTPACPRDDSDALEVDVVTEDSQSDHIQEEPEEKSNSDVSLPIPDTANVSMDSLEGLSRSSDKDKESSIDEKCDDLKKALSKSSKAEPKSPKKNFVEINSRKAFVRRVDAKQKPSVPTVDPKVTEVRKKWSSSTPKKTPPKATDAPSASTSPQSKKDTNRKSKSPSLPKAAESSSKVTEPSDTPKAAEIPDTPKTTDSSKLSAASSDEGATPESKRASNQWKRELEYPMKGGTCPWVKAFDAEIKNMETFPSNETADAEVKKALDELSGSEWSQKEESMVTVMRIFRYHHDIARENMHKIILALCTEMKSLRQSVAGKAILTIGYMYTTLGKDLENKLRIVIDALLNRSGNRTLASGYRLVLRTLFHIVRGSTPFKAALAFAAEGTRHANKASRETAAQFLATIIESLGPIKSLHPNMAPSMLRCAAIFALDGSPLTRHCGKLMFHVMLQNPNFDNLKNKHIEPSSVRNLTKILETVKSKGVSREKLPIHIMDLEET